MIQTLFVSFTSIAMVLATSGCANSEPNAKPTLHATDNTAAQNKEIARYLIRTEYSQWDNAPQLQCLDDLWQAESRWNHRARNKRTGACGIPQSYPCKKMSASGKAYGVDYRTNPWPQIAWGLQYVDKRYRTPCAAWKRFQRGGGY
jgi:hypothetical protein